MKTHLVAALLLVACLAGCIKDPSCPPHPSNKGWLISEVTQIRYLWHSTPSAGSYQKTVHKIQYNAFNKPVLRLTAESPQNDTSNLPPTYIDSLAYDQQQRMTEIRRYSILDWAIYGRKFIYQGNDTIPSTQIVYDSIGSMQMFTDTIQYRYSPAVVTAISSNIYGNTDTTEYIYTAGNLTHTSFNGATPPLEVLSDYDSTVNFERYFNLPHEVFGLADGSAHQPRLSQNNWRKAVSGGGTRVLTFDSRGLVIQTETYFSSTPLRIISRYSYIERE